MAKDSEMELVIGLYDHSDYDLICLHESEEINLPLLTKAIIKMYCNGKKATFLLPKVSDPFANGEIVHRRYTYMVRFYPGRDDECISILNTIQHNFRVGFIKNMVRASILGGFNDFYFDSEVLSAKHHSFATSPGVPVLDYDRIIKGKNYSSSKQQDLDTNLSSEIMAVSNPSESYVKEAEKLIAEDRKSMQIAQDKADKKRGRKKKTEISPVPEPKQASLELKVEEPVKEKPASTDNQIIDIFTDEKPVETVLAEKKEPILKENHEDKPIELGDLFSGITEEY